MEISQKISPFSDKKKDRDLTENLWDHKLKKKKDCDLTYISDKSEHANTFDEKKVNIKNL